MSLNSNNNNNNMSFNSTQQSSSVQQSSDDPSFPSICIPHTWGTTTWMQVKEVFEQLFGVGCIERVDVVKRRNHNPPQSSGRQQEFAKVFVHFKAWPDTDMAQEFRNTILEGKCMKIVYNEPWFWKCFKNNSQRRSYNGGARPYIQAADDVHRPSIVGGSAIAHENIPVVGGDKETDPVPNNF